MNHQLPGRVSTRWFRTVLTVLATAIATVWILALLPFLLLAALVLALLMVPALRRLRNEIQIHHDEMDLEHSPIDVTPWHRQVRNGWNTSTARNRSKKQK